jgi:predicted RecB family nuclease
MGVPFTATELANFLECEHRTVLDRLVRSRKLERPGQTELERDLLRKRGEAHEATVLAHYEGRGLGVVKIPRTPDAAEKTLGAMQRGAEVIYQGVLQNGDWVGRPDFLVKRAGKGNPGWGHHYEVVDAKLAQEAKASAVLQLCAYTEQLAGIQGCLPESLHIAPGGQGEPIPLRVADYLAYYRSIRQRFEAFVALDAPLTYPEPVEHCAACPWWKRCEDQRRADDHLSLVANITRRQRDRLEEAQLATLQALAASPPDLTLEGLETLGRLREQAALQAARRSDGTPRYRLLGDDDRKPVRVPPGAMPPLVGLEALPEPTPGDLFLDLEGDSFVEGVGLEYLFGLLELGEPLDDEFTSRDAPGEPRYLPFWARQRADEKQAFERVIDRIVRGRLEFKKLHVFHFGHRESDALKKLSCRHKTREAEVDQLLREHVLVDLHAVVRHALLAGVESYSLKELEALHGFTRATDLRGASRAMQLYGWWLETRDPTLQLGPLEAQIALYNRDDCLSTWKLRDWLEGRRREFAELMGRAPARPAWVDVPERTHRNEASAALGRRLSEGVADPPDGDLDGAARVLLSNLLDWHWREAKSAWWEHFRARELAPDDYLRDRAALGGLEYVGEVGKVKRSLVHRYRFPDQDHGIRRVPAPIDPATGASAGEVVEIGQEHLDLKRGAQSSTPHPGALIPGAPLDTKAQEQALIVHGEHLAADFTGASMQRAAWRLLRRLPPDLGQPAGSALLAAGEPLEQALPRLALAMKGDVLAIQGPPGSGKTHQAALLILELVRGGKRVGVTANSHEVIKGVLRKVAELGLDVTRILHVQDPADVADKSNEPFTIDDDKESARARLERRELWVVGGTSWTWASENFAQSLDYLVVDEAGQVSLANVLAVAQSSTNLILVGDPAQLEQPQKGVHPPGADVSALQHLLGGESVTLPADRGIFLPVTRRLHPAVCAFISESFYDGRLTPIDGLEQQSIEARGHAGGVGLRFIPVPHRGNTNQSPEEAAAVVALLDELGLTRDAVSSLASYVDNRGSRRPLTREDVLVVTPYNAQLGTLTRALPTGIRIGTVDRFQGKQAPLVIYSMATSTAAEAPRGLEFLYSRNRLNVAVSRAMAVAVILASPDLVRVACRTPRQMTLVNGLCRFVELSSM